MTLDDVLKAKEDGRNIPWKTCSDNDLREYHKRFHKRMNRGEIKEVDGGFYRYIMAKKRKFIDELLSDTLRREKGYFDSMSNKELKEYCKNNYGGMSRSEIKANNPSLYSHIFHKRRDAMDEILPESLFMDWEGMSDKEIKEYLNKNFNGKGRAELQAAYPGLYDHLIAKRKKLLDKILPSSINLDWKRMSDKELKEYCKENYDGMSRSEIADANSGLYNHLKKKRRNAMDEILPESLFMDWEGMSDKEIKEYCKNNYGGMSRSEIAFANPGFYGYIKNRKKSILKSIPKIGTVAYKFNGREENFDSRPERIVGILLSKYYGYQPKEGENLHKKTNGTKRHSIDFLIIDKFIEYHELQPSDKGLTIEQAGEKKKRHITNPELINCDFYHIWKVEQLYPVMMNGTNKYVLPKYQNISKEQFNKDVSLAYKQAAKYDALHQGAAA